MNAFSDCIRGKNRAFASNFAAQRVEINGVQVQFNAEYFCRKLRYMYEDYWGSIICFAGKHLKARQCFQICYPAKSSRLLISFFRPEARPTVFVVHEEMVG